MLNEESELQERSHERPAVNLNPKLLGEASRPETRRILRSDSDPLAIRGRRE